MSKLPKDIYKQCNAIARSYYTMLARRKEQEEEILHGSKCSDGQPRGSSIGDPTAAKAARLIELKERNDFKIKAVEQAWCRMVDVTARRFIKKNVFEGVPMNYIDLPMSIRSMKRTRKCFITYVAEELKEI